MEHANGRVDAPQQANNGPVTKLKGAVNAASTRCKRGLVAWRDRLQSETPSTMLQLAVLFGVVAGVIAWLYDMFLTAMLALVWTWIPQRGVQPLLDNLSNISWWPATARIAWVYTVLISTSMGLLAGLVQKGMGFPGDLPDTVRCVHDQGFIPIKQAPSMFLCSALSITAGGSLGPEAALLALCAASCSWVAKNVLLFQGKHLRHATLMGMTAGLAAFFGVALGGSLFALEVLHRTGLQFFEISTYAVACGTLCLVVYRGLSNKDIGGIWSWSTELKSVYVTDILAGAFAGLLSAALAMLFIEVFLYSKKLVRKIGLDEHKTPVVSGVLGGLVVGIVGVLLPPTMFWGEYEIGTIADPSQPLMHIWPKGGVWGLEPFAQGNYTSAICFTTAIVKLIAIVVTVLSGFRGGFIFPLFLAGAAFGRGLSQLTWLPYIGSSPPVLMAMAMAAGLNVAITRTPFATSLILTVLGGQPGTMVPCLAASLVSLFVTLQWPFITSQRDRDDILYRVVQHDDPYIVVKKTSAKSLEEHGEDALNTPLMMDEQTVIDDYSNIGGV